MQSNTIPLLDLVALHRDHQEELNNAIRDVCDQASFIQGPALSRFEKRFGEWVGDGLHCVGCANGTDAISILARALDLPPHSEVILPAMTYVATAEALADAGFSLKLVDVDARTGLMDCDSLESLISARTKLIVPVHP